MKRANYDHRRLLFRRQFVLGQRFLDGFPSWKRLEMRPSFFLTVHPDLDVCRAGTGDITLVLLGYILDPYRPGDRDVDILQRLLRHFEEGGTRESLIRLTDPLGGRWVLIVDTPHAQWLFNDPCGYRQVFYARTPSHPPWCASQPGLLAEVLGLTVDRDALSFIRAFRRRQPQYWWPGDSSPYKEVRHLLPNHYLDLEDGTPHRFWPDRELKKRTLDEVVEENANLLQGLIDSASRRFELALTITAGKDTRLLLAASKAIRHQLYCYTMIYWDLTWSSRDIQVPSRLLSRLGLPHHVIVCPSRTDREFAEIYRRNVATAHPVYSTLFQGLYNDYPQTRVGMKGNGIPVDCITLRGSLKDPTKELEPQTLAWLMRRWTGLPSGNDFALEALDRWLSGVDQAEVEILDLFEWENHEGNWQATALLEEDIAKETFAPFNCRLFLTNMLSVPERALPACILHKKLTRHLWPETLSEPINPPVRPTVVSIARELLKSPVPKNVDWLYSRTVAGWRRRDRSS